MSHEKESQHGRFEDKGFPRIVKEYWVAICLIFTLGGLYQEARTNASLSEKLSIKLDDHEKRMTQVEDAVKYLAQIVKYDRRVDK